MPLHDINAERSTEERINTAMKVISKNLLMLEASPNIRLFALMKLVCLELVLELAHLPWREVRKRSFDLFRKSLDELHVKLETVQAVEQKANDDA